MRLYAVIPNRLYLQKIHKNNKKFGRILVNDLFTTPHGLFLPVLTPLLEIWDKMDFVGSSIVLYTTPAEMKKYVDQNFIGIAIETNDNVLNINADKFFYFFSKMFNENKHLFSSGEDRKEKFAEFVDRVSLSAPIYEKEISKVDNFYDSFGILNELNINEIRNIYYTQDNLIFPEIKADKENRLYNFVEIEKGQEF